MNDDSHKKPLVSSVSVVSVVLPLALEAAYSYSVPAGVQVEVGDYVNVPLGPRRVVGVVWKTDGGTPQGVRLRDIAEKFDLPAMSDTQRAFLQWLADYYMAPLGMVLRGCLRAKGIFEPTRMKVAYRLSDHRPERMTPQRQKVIEAAGDLPAMQARELADEAGVGVSVVKGLAEQGVFEAVDLPPFSPFD